MARPDFRIWKDKPEPGKAGQYVDIQDPTEYYSIGFDSFTPDDDIYTSVAKWGRGSDNSHDYFLQNSSGDLEDYIYGVGEFRIHKWKIGDNWYKWHHKDHFYIFVVDSADFQCETGAEVGCNGPSDSRLPQNSVSGVVDNGDGTWTTGTYTSSTSDLVKYWISDESAFAKDRFLYKIRAYNNFDCVWGGHDEWEAASAYQIVGEKVTDLHHNESLDYFPSGPQNSDTDGVWQWKFFPRMDHPNTIRSDKYDYENLRCPNCHDSIPENNPGKDWFNMIRPDVFSNSVNSYYDGLNQEFIPDKQHYWDYDDGFFYIGMYIPSAVYCGSAWEDFSTDTAIVIYSIPKKHIYDHWNSTKTICFQWGTQYPCSPGFDQIKYKYTIPPTVDLGNGSKDRFWNGLDMKITITPPRRFYQEDENARAWRPTDQTDLEYALYGVLKNPMQKDPGIPFWSEDEDCIYPGQGDCNYSSFYPYVVKNAPYRYSPYYHFDFKGNIAGLTDGTIGKDRPDLNDTVNWYLLQNESSLLQYSKLYEITPQYIKDRDYRPISYAWVEDEDIDLGLSVQRGYQEGSLDEARTSAPNIVNLWLHMAKPIIAGSNFDFHDLSPEFWSDDIYLKTGMGYKWCVARWGDEEDAGDPLLDNIILGNVGQPGEIPSFETSPVYYNEKLSKGLYSWVNVKDDSGLGVLSHQYQTDGIKTIKALSFSYIYNTDQNQLIERIFPTDHSIPFQTVEWKLITIKIKINLSGVFVEDFSEVGGSDFKYIPMKSVTPIIGGLHSKSKYIKSLDKIYASNLFDESEVVDKLQNKKAKVNDNFGYWPGKMDIEQIRMFNKPMDMHRLLGIEENIIVTQNRIRMFDYLAHWDGKEYFYSNETSVKQIFIDDNVDRNLKSACVLELNSTNVVGNKILDTSGHGNVGILLGDYSLIKANRGEEVTRDTDIRTPKNELNPDNGAL